jgi:hypothetical protein
MLGIFSASDLPVLWDAVFLLGTKSAEGADNYVLCEINVSSVYPFPPSALPPLSGRHWHAFSISIETAAAFA